MGIGVTLADVQAARERIRGAIYDSPCPESIPLSELTGCRVYCKLDYLQRTGSFKERGARNALLLLDEAKRRRGVIAASAGNHALALSYHSKLLGIPATVVMPRFAPLIKVTSCRRMGATVVLHGEDFAQARAKADELAQQQGLTYIHGFNDPAIIAGQGTLGLEILEQVPDVEAVVVPIGGGGLIAGIALAVKAIRPQVQVIGVEAAASPAFAAAMEAGRPVQVPIRPTLADGLAVGRVGDLALELARQHVDRAVQVDEDALGLAILRLLEMEKSVVEGAGAAPLAALLSGQLPELAGKRVVLVLCGGNIDPAVLCRVVEHGLVVDGRLCRFTAVISDRPGGLEKLARAIASCGASIKEVVHERAFAEPDISTVRVVCTVETADREHVATLLDRLRSEGFQIWPEAYRSEAAGADPKAPAAALPS
ncbi:MAG TPA: threonine ammonia-lyase [Phycisphaeraceae bacterium]